MTTENRVQLIKLPKGVDKSVISRFTYLSTLYCDNKITEAQKDELLNLSVSMIPKLLNNISYLLKQIKAFR